MPLLLESGDYLLLESGDNLLLEDETAGGGITITPTPIASGNSLTTPTVLVAQPITITIGTPIASGHTVTSPLGVGEPVEASSASRRMSISIAISF